jgi:hypothetical protein
MEDKQEETNVLPEHLVRSWTPFFMQVSGVVQKHLSSGSVDMSPNPALYLKLCMPLYIIDSVYTAPIDLRRNAPLFGNKVWSQRSKHETNYRYYKYNCNS